MGGVQGAADERVCDVGRPAGPMTHWQKERAIHRSTSLQTSSNLDHLALKAKP